MDSAFEEETRSKIIRNIFPDSSHQESTGEIFVYCPKHYHHKRKLQINVKKNTFRCWICGEDFQGSVFKLLRQYGSRKDRQEYLKTVKFADKVEEKQVSIGLPDEYRFLLDHKNTPVGLEAYAFLREFGITDHSILLHRVGCSVYDRSIIFPSFDGNGNLNYYIKRFLDGSYLDCEGRKKDIIFNEIYVNWYRPIILTEGIKTSLRHYLVPNVIPLLGSHTINETYRTFSEIVIHGKPFVYLALDPEAEDKAIYLAKKLSEFGIEGRIVSFPKQPDEISTSKFIECLKNYRAFDDNFYILKKVSKL